MVKQIGVNIKRFRSEKGMTQKELGQIIGKSESYISDAENGKNGITVVALNDIATALKVPVMRLIDADYGTEKSEYDEYMKLRIYNQDERLDVSKILVKNGYTVAQTKQKRTETGKVLDYYVVAKLNEENADTAR